MIKNLQVNLAHYKAIQEWEPQVGDVIIHHGLLTHWFGVISQIDPNGSIEVVSSGLPLLLLTLSGKKLEKSKKNIDVSDIKTSKGGKYAAIKSTQNVIVWYV